MKSLLRGIPVFLLALAWMSAAVCAHADTILSTTSTVDMITTPFSGAAAITDQQYLAFSFSLGNPYDDVSIRFHDLNYMFDNATFWLTDALGPSAKSSDVVATRTFFGNGHFNDPSEFVPLSGLTLGAGTYFMIFSSPFCDVRTDAHCRSQVGFLGLGQRVLIDAVAGVTYNGGFAATDGLGCHQSGTCEIDFDFPPASLWHGSGDPHTGSPRFEIRGKSIPEPESMWLVGAGLAVMGVTRRLRKILSNQDHDPS